MAKEPKQTEKHWSEEIVVAGSDLVERIKSIAREGNVRRVIIRKPSGETLLEIPLTAGVVTGGGLILLAPVIAALGALAALLAEVKVEIVHSGGGKQ